jgi:hypothetical protein
VVRQLMGMRGRSLLKPLAGLCFLLGLSACSPAGWFGKPDGDQGVLNQRPQGRSNPRCQGVDLSHGELDVPTFRKLVSCFNSNGTLEPLEKLTLRATDAQLRPLMHVVNESVLSNPTLLYDLTATYRHWVAQALLDSSFSKFGSILENEDFVASAVVLLKGAYEAIDDRALLLEGISRLSSRLDVDAIRGGMDAAISFSESRVAQGLLEKIRSERPGAPALRSLTDGVWAYAQETRPEELKGLASAAVLALSNGKFFAALDQGLGQTDGQLQQSIPELAALLDSLLGHEGRLAEQVTTLFGAIRRPIPCLDGARSVQDPASFVIGEMHLRFRERPEEFLWRQNPLALVAMNSFCDYPAELDSSYEAMKELAMRPGFRRMANLLGGLYEQGLVPLLSGVLGDVGPHGRTGIKHLLPLLQEARERGLVGELLLAVALVRTEDRAVVQRVAAFLGEPIRASRTETWIDVLAQGVAGVDRENLYRLVLSLGRFAESEEAIVAPTLRGLRTAMFVNNVHPVTDLLRSLLGRATQEEALFETLFFLAVQPEFRDSIRLVSTMAKDGRLRELIGAVLELFSGVAQRGRHEGIVLTQEPGFESLARHHWRASDPFFVSAYPTAGVTPAVASVCSQMRFDLPLSDTGAQGYDQQLDALLGCLDQNREYSDVVRFVRYLRCDRSTAAGPCAGSTLRGRDYYSFTLDLIRALNIGTENLSDLMDRFMLAVRDGRADRALQLAALPLVRSYEGGTVARAAAGWAQAVFPSIRAPLQRLFNYGAEILRRTDLHLGVQLIDRLRKAPEGIRTSSTPAVQFDELRLSTRIRNKECPEDLRAVPQRIAEAKADFLEGITNWEWLDGRGRRSWSFDELKELLDPVVAKLGDREQGHPDRPVAEALLNVLKYFSLRPGEARSRSKHWRPEQLLDFLHSRSDDVQMITYFYPGETVPRVRLVNSLDRLELILTNADMQYLLPYNFGMRFLARLGMAWGDEPRDLWPEPIQQMYGRGSRPPTLREAYVRIVNSLNQLERMLGYPYRPVCDQLPDPTDENLEWYGGRGWARFPLNVRAAVFNIRQVIGVVEENLPDAETPHRNGMRILRNLFYELYASNPDEVFDERYMNYWSTAGLRNNLSVIVRLVRAGLIRQVGRSIRQWPAPNADSRVLTSAQRLDRDSLSDLFASLIDAAQQPGTADLIRELVAADPERELIWNVIRKVFEVLDDPDTAKADRLRQSAYYLVANLKTLNITADAVRVLRPVIRNHAPYLKANAGILVELLLEPSVAKFLQSFYADSGKSVELPAVQGLFRQVLSQPDRAEDLFRILEVTDSNRVAKAQWELLKRRLDSIAQSSEYRRIETRDIWDSLFQYLSQPPETAAGRSSARLCDYAAGRLHSGPQGVSDVLDLVSLLSRNPDEFDRLMQTLARSIERGEVSDLLHMAERALSRLPRQ